MTYTEIYRHVYSLLKNDSVDHHLAHNISLRITEALSDYRMSSFNSKEAIPSIVNNISEYIEW